MKGIDIYRLIGMCVLVVAAWCVQVVGLSNFRTEARNGPPTMNIVDFDKDFSGEGSDRPLVEHGYNLNAPFVSTSGVQERITEHKKKKWIGLVVGIAGTIGVFLVAYKIWNNWVTGIACVLIGPLGVAWGIQRSNRNG